MPTYNEEKTIGELISRVRRVHSDIDIVVIDDGSSDSTYRIAKQNMAIVLKSRTNQGKGASLIKGFNYALLQNYDALITMDSDGQHEPADIAYFLRLANYSDSGIFIGNRMLKPKDMPFIRFLTNKFMSWVISKVIKQYIPDTQCGFRLIKAEVLKKIGLKTCKYETESEILIKAARLGYRIESIPIKSIYSGQMSRINPFTDACRFFRLIAKEALNHV